MTKSNLIIRMIDVVFILLFGFIAVSQIGTTISIEPPKSEAAENEVPDNSETIVVGVSKEGYYSVEEKEQPLKTINELETFLQGKKTIGLKNNKLIGVRIRADFDAPVEYGLGVVKLCRDLGIAKGLDVVKVNQE